MIELALEAAPNICVFICVSIFINIDWINCDYHLYKLCPCVCPQQIGVMFNDETKRNNYTSKFYFCGQTITNGRGTF